MWERIPIDGVDYLAMSRRCTTIGRPKARAPKWWPKPLDYQLLISVVDNSRFIRILDSHSGAKYPKRPIRVSVMKTHIDKRFGGDERSYSATQLFAGLQGFGNRPVRGFMVAILRDLGGLKESDEPGVGYPKFVKGNWRDVERIFESAK